MLVRLLLVLLLACGPWLTGCAAPVIIAAGVGTGYVMTDDRSRRKVDRFFQDLSRSVKQTTRRLSGDQPARRTSVSGRTAAFTLRVRKTTLAPATVGKGATVTVTLQYALSGGPADGSRVEVKRSLLKEGKRLTVLNTETQLIAQRRLAVDLQARELDTRIALASALGGGWTDDTQAIAAH